jgi:hypothetical protein
MRGRGDQCRVACHPGIGQMLVLQLERTFVKKNDRVEPKHQSGGFDQQQVVPVALANMHLFVLKNQRIDPLAGQEDQREERERCASWNFLRKIEWFYSPSGTFTGLILCETGG